MKMVISIAQFDVATADPARNLDKTRNLMREAAEGGSDLVCFPEMWTTGFNWEKNAAMATEHETALERVGEWAREFGIWVNGTLLSVNGAGRPVNRSVLFDTGGKLVAIYDKLHLFSLMDEDVHMAPGANLTTAETPWGTVGLSVCYDLRFPELFRSYALKGVELQLCPSAFPHPRREHWRILTRARAIENQMYFIAVNQVGEEDFGANTRARYFGTSTIIDPWGETVLEADECEESLLTASIDLHRVAEVRAQMRVLGDRRPEVYELG